MANVDRPNGFKFSKSLLGMAPNAMIRLYPAADRTAATTGNGGDIYLGDPVKIVAGLAVTALSGNTVVGVCVGVGENGSITHGDTGYFNADDLSERYAALEDATGVIIAVMPAEGNLFEIQTATDLDLLPGSLADTNIALITTVHGDRTTSRSICELVVASANDVKVVEQVTTPDNDATIVNARHIVKFQITENAL